VWAVAARRLRTLVQRITPEHGQDMVRTREVHVTSSAAGPTDPPAEVLQNAAAAFSLLSSTMRLHIVWVLAQGDCDVTGLAERVGGTLPAVSQHLAKLKLAGLVRARREGRRQVYLVDDPDVVTAVRLMVGQLAQRADHANRPARLRSARDLGA
jgi:DNA-binding transcriptional ArsR family regulator